MSKWHDIDKHCAFICLPQWSRCSLYSLVLFFHLFVSLVEVVAALILVVFPFTDSSAHSGPDSGPGRTDGPGDPHQASCGVCASCGLISWRPYVASHCSKH